MIFLLYFWYGNCYKWFIIKLCKNVLLSLTLKLSILFTSLFYLERTTNTSLSYSSYSNVSLVVIKEIYWSMKYRWNESHSQKMIFSYKKLISINISTFIIRCTVDFDFEAKNRVCITFFFFHKWFWFQAIKLSFIWLTRLSAGFPHLHREKPVEMRLSKGHPQARVEVVESVGGIRSKGRGWR